MGANLVYPAIKLYPAPMPSVVSEPRERSAGGLYITTKLEIEQTDGTRTRCSNCNRRVK
jgi:hypothetical protein